MCEYDGSGYYLSVGCSTSATFTIDRFTDQYCMEKYDTYDTLSNLNSALKSLSRCYNLYSSNVDENPKYAVSWYLAATSGSCSASESSVCKTNDFVSSSGSSSGFQRTSNKLTSGVNLSFTNKLKYGLGSAMFLGSVIMFIGILFTNRRKRRAMMHRKFRQGASKSSRSKSKRRSSSKSNEKKRGSRKSGGGVFA